MGVTYWQLGEQNRALELTQKRREPGRGGGRGRHPRHDSTLGVPYGNLATMYQKMGENTNAAKYAELAKTVAPAAAAASTASDGRHGWVAVPKPLGQNPNANRRTAQRPMNLMR